MKFRRDERVGAKLNAFGTLLHRQLFLTRGLLQSRVYKAAWTWDFLKESRRVMIDHYRNHCYKSLPGRSTSYDVSAALYADYSRFNDIPWRGVCQRHIPRRGNIYIRGRGNVRTGRIEGTSAARRKKEPNYLPGVYVCVCVCVCTTSYENLVVAAIGIAATQTAPFIILLNS